MNKYVKKEIDFAGKKLVLETGELAVRANMAVKATFGDTVLLATACAKDASEDANFFGLRIEYEEKLFASGSIKSSRFVKRDGRSTDDAVVARRAIDHAVRPLFPKGFWDEVQIAITVLSLDETSDAEFLAMVATAAALEASDIPFYGPMTSARIGYVDNEFVLCPSREVIEEKSEMDMLVSFVGDDRRFLALEADAEVLPEKVILDGIKFAREEILPLATLIKDFAKELNPEGKKYEFISHALSEEVLSTIKEFAGEKIDSMFTGSKSRYEMDEIRTVTLKETAEKFEEVYSKGEVKEALYTLEKEAIRTLVLEKNTRLDGRDFTTVRPISTKVSLLPRTHGSALFTRGQTQALTVVTLGSPSEEMLIQDMYGERSKRYLHFYHFPPYSVGEVGRFGGAKPREIGHGMIAEKALKPVVPSQDKFPYTIILNSEIVSSNGSSSMASTCGSSLALMDAGVPIKEMVGGIAMGLVTKDEEFSDYHFLSDLSGEEDGAGHLDYKMTGTKTGVTAIQCDMKLKGIPFDKLEELFKMSTEARLHVISEMEKTISEPKAELSEYAPKTVSLQISPDKIGAVIGSGGKVIKKIQEDTDTVVSIEEDGKVVISAINKENAEQAKTYIEALALELKIGDIFEGTVVEILGFGALVEIAPGKTGLLHVSELANEYVENVEDHVKIGDTVKVKVVKVSDDGKFGLSIKALAQA